MLLQTIYKEGCEKRCLIVSPHFPPSTLAGVHRARHLVKYLPVHGWRPTVICVDPRCHIERLDPQLAKLVPTDADIVRVGALPVCLTKLFGVAGDIGLRGYFYLRAALARQINSARPDAVLITGSPYYPMLLAGWIQRNWKLPVVLDFQDPWVSHTGANAAYWSKAGLSHRLAVAYEPRALRHAAFVTSVSDLQNREMAERYHWIDPLFMAGIPIGGDPDDFDAIRHLAKLRPRPGVPFTLSYVGTALPRSTALFTALFRSIASLLVQQPNLAARLRLRFVGTSNQPNDDTSFPVRALAAAEGIDHLVTEEPARVPYIEALKILATSDALMMIGSDEPHYTASKIYPALMSGRPYLSIFHRKSSAHEILINAGGGIALAFSSPTELEALVPRIGEGVRLLVQNAALLGEVNPKAYEPYTANAVAGRFADVFVSALQRQSTTNRT